MKQIKLFHYLFSLLEQKKNNNIDSSHVGGKRALDAEASFVKRLAAFLFWILFNSSYLTFPIIYGKIYL